MDRFDVDDLDEDWRFEIDRHASHLFKHPGVSLDDIGDVSASEPLFYPAKPPAHPLMVAELAGRLLIVPDQPLAAGWRRRNTGDRRRCRPNGCYVAADHLARRYREDR